MRPSRFVPSIRLLWSLLAAVSLASACGEDAPSSATPSQVCAANSVSCKGNYVATCAADGKSQQLQFCGASKYCAAGECKATVCPRGQLTCSGQDVLRCPDDGASEPTKVKTCKASEPCKDGACIPGVCPQKGAAWCGNATLFLCNDANVIEAISCGADKICDVASKSCIARTCEPTSAQCKDAKTTEVCSIAGDSYKSSACPSGQGCVGGVCQVLLSGGTVTDAAGSASDGASVGDGVSIGTGDTLTKPKKDVVVQAPDVFKVIIAKTKAPGSGDATTAFDFASASYSKSTQLLTISGDKDLYKIEIQLGKMEEFQTGTFSQVGGEAADTKILVNDGSNDQTQVQWLYAAADYDLELTEFGDISTGRIVGTFSAELINTVDKKTPLYLIDGSFDIVRQ